MIKVLVDLYKSKNPNSGLGQFSLSYAEAIKKKKLKYKLTFLWPNKENPYKGEISILRPNALQKFTAIKGYDIWHSLYQLPSYLPGKKAKYVLTIHDLNFLKEKSEAKAKKYLKKVQQHVDRADAITVISKYVEKDVKKHLKLGKKKLHVIPNGVRLKTFSKAKKPDFVKNKPFLFSIGIISAKKNLDKLIPMMEHLDDYHLIIAGNKSSDYANDLEKTIKSKKLGNRIKLVGQVSDEEKYWLLNHCEGLVFPSMAEGFGIPAIEAMLCGKPAFLSKEGSLPEIGGEYANYWDSWKPKDMAQLIKSSLKEFNKNHNENASRLKIYAKQFSWEKCIEKYIEVYKSLS